MTDPYTYLPKEAKGEEVSEFFSEMQKAFDNIGIDRSKMVRVCALFFCDDPIIAKAGIKGDPFFGPKTTVTKYK